MRWAIAGECLSDVVAGNVVRVRLGRGWTQGELCERLGAVLGCTVSQAVLSQWERCRAPLRLDLVAALAHVFDCSLADLLRTPSASQLPAVCRRGPVTLQDASTGELLDELRRRLDGWSGATGVVTPPAYLRSHGRVRD